MQPQRARGVTVHSLLAQQHLLLQMGQYHGCASLPSNCHFHVRAYVTRVSQCVRAGTRLARASKFNNEHLLSTTPHWHTVLQTTQKCSTAASNNTKAPQAARTRNAHGKEDTVASGSRGASPERGSEREITASATHAHQGGVGTISCSSSPRCVKRQWRQKRRMHDGF